MHTPDKFNTFTAAGDIAAKRIVSVAADCAVSQAVNPTASSLGVTELFCSDGDPVDVATAGIVEVEAAEAINHGCYVTANEEGRAVAAALTDAALGMAINDAAAGEYVSVRIAPQRSAFEDSSVIRFKNAAAREYNSEWVSRMTGEGTELSPYLIRTPYDFNAIRENPGDHYVLMNDLDFSEAIGITVSLENGGLAYGSNNEDAPLYNNSQGWEPIAEFTGVLNGNGKTLRGLVCCRDQEFVGLCAVMNCANISNLTIKDSIFISPRQSGAIGAIAGKMNNESHIQNCVSYATVYSSNPVGELWMGGIVGDTNGLQFIKNCANRGRLESLCDRALAGGIAGPDSSGCQITGCCNTANITAKKAAGIAVDSEQVVNCYNVGMMSGWDRNGSITCNDAAVSNCCSLTGCAANMQGTVLTASQMQAASTPDALNAGLQEPVFVATDNGYPVLDFEVLNAQSLAPGLNLAVIDADKQEALLSGLTLQWLLHQPSRKLYQDLKAEIVSKPTVSKLALTLGSSDWDNGSQTVSASGVNSNSALVMVPKAADAFTAGLAISSQGNGSITFSCSDAPNADIAVDVLVIN